MNTQTHFSGSFGTESITFDQGEEKLVSKNSPSLQKEQTTKGTTDDITQVFTNAGEQEKILTMDEYWELLSRKILITDEKCFRKCREMEAPTRWGWEYIPTIPEHFGEVVVDIMKEGNLSAKSFIDVGCGVPILPDFMKDLGCKDVHGLEYNASIVKLVQPHYPDIVLHEGDMMTYQEYGKYDILYTYNPFYDSQKMADALLVIMEQMKFGAVLYYNPVRISYQFLEKWGFEELPTDLYGFYKFTKGA